MRKNFNVLSVLSLLFFSLLFSACSGFLTADSDAASVPSPESTSVAATPTPSTAPEKTPPVQAFEEDSSAALIQKSFGTYSIAEEWFESEELSSENKFFYLKDGTSLDKPTSNISVSMGENRYDKDDFQSFAQAIDRQTKQQIGPEVTEYFGSGSYTDNDYPLITIIIETEDMRIIQHYIVGDFRFVMVYLTDFGDEQIPDAEEAALAIVNSFLWEE